LTKPINIVITLVDTNIICERDLLKEIHFPWTYAIRSSFYGWYI